MSLLLLSIVCTAQPSDAVDEDTAPLSTPPQTEYFAQEFGFKVVPSSTNLPTWAGTQAQCDVMVADAVSWAACNGLMMRTASTDGKGPYYTHAPFSLHPCELPVSALAEAYELQPLFGKLVEAVSQDISWLSRTLADAAESDEFTRNLLTLCERVQREGSTQWARLAILRSDYMLHQPREEEGQLLQVELNTISSSFGGLSQKVAAMHRFFIPRWESTRRHVWQSAGEPSSLSLESVLPTNEAADNIAEGLAQAHALYANPDAFILFIVQPNEHNHIDQDLLREKLWSGFGVRVLCRTLDQLDTEAKLMGAQRRLTLPAGEVSVVYFRAGYTPDDYPFQRMWDARTVVERSYAIKCPCVEHQLVGCKKVQQQLALPGELEYFMSAEECSKMRKVFAGLWSLSGMGLSTVPPSETEQEAAEMVKLALEDPTGFVMKPQREVLHPDCYLIAT